jgi:omega-amidase
MALRITLVQFDAAIGSPDANLTRASDWVREAGRRSSDLVLLPELWQDGLAYAQAAELAAPMGEGSFAHMERLAAEAGVYLAGSAFERAGDSIYNTLALYSPRGELLTCYRKIHLFDPMEENRFLTAGDALVVADLPWGPTGLTICYDLRFPELYRRYAADGALLMLVPAQWPHARVAHWRTLARARAIENQVFVLACNRAGRDGQVEFGGHSVVCDPWGERLVEGGREPALLTIDIDLHAVEAARRRIPVWPNRRPDVYG